MRRVCTGTLVHYEHTVRPCHSACASAWRSADTKGLTHTRSFFSSTSAPSSWGILSSVLISGTRTPVTAQVKKLKTTGKHTPSGEKSARCTISKESDDTGNK